MYHALERGGMRRIFWSENLKERDHSENIGVYGRIILQRILGKYGAIVNWMHLVQDRDQWWALCENINGTFCSVKDGEFLD
jgi:hypothetical protein